MAQFDVHQLADGSLVVDAQTDLLDIHRTRFVIPLVEIDDDARALARLNLALPFDGGKLLLATHLAGAVPAGILRSPVGSLADHDLAIKAALDMLISGF